MRPVECAGATVVVLYAPHGLEAEVAPLPACRIMVGTRPAIASTWELDEAELYALCAQGGRLQLTVLGLHHPPVLLEVVPRGTPALP